MSTAVLDDCATNGVSSFVAEADGDGATVSMTSDTVAPLPVARVVTLLTANNNG